ncbi:MAG TPA: hypothetical protein VER79_01255 [Candidatus Limnocylindrales bacterium]|nr:hypothetical protein [Candidatus Limnocylindrales bacterium]
MRSQLEEWLCQTRLFLTTPQREAGQGLVEYAMILILAVVLVIVILTFFAPWLNNVYMNVIVVL